MWPELLTIRTISTNDMLIVLLLLALALASFNAAPQVESERTLLAKPEPAVAAPFAALLEPSGRPADFGECERAFPHRPRPTATFNLQARSNEPYWRRICTWAK